MTPDDHGASIVSYFDRDWMTGDDVEEQPRLVYRAGKGLRWAGGDWIQVPDGLTSDEAAASLIDALARAVVLRVPPSGSVSVPGYGVVAERVRSLLGDRVIASPNTGPDVVIETSGTGTGLADATAAVGDLGTVVLAAGGATGLVELDIYQDLHRRGIHLRGVPSPEEIPEADEACVAIDAPADGPQREPGARWFSIRG